MGYRNKIAILSKDVHEQIRGLTYGELVKWHQASGKDPVLDDYVPAYEIAEELYCLGKYCQLEITNFKRPVFDKTRTHNKFNDGCEFYFIGKDGLLAIIESYRLKIVEYYEGLIDPSKQGPFKTTTESHLRSQLAEWNNEYCRPYDLREDSDEIVSSWKYEYAIFELVRILKSIDFETHDVCITGW